MCWLMHDWNHITVAEFISKKCNFMIIDNGCSYAGQDNDMGN